MKVPSGFFFESGLVRLFYRTLYWYRIWYWHDVDPTDEVMYLVSRVPYCTNVTDRQSVWFVPG